MQTEASSFIMEKSYSCIVMELRCQ
uniref:BLTX336 n=1 Tax=Nephila pilipes TaxID=299642 RepID=A0A076KZY3_NEPPI|nr:BLTX336 [Nephila pilipes]